MVAIGGVVPLQDTLKQTHQSMDSVAIMKPVTTPFRLLEVRGLFLWNSIGHQSGASGF
jgi:hypothetical protein